MVTTPVPEIKKSHVTYCSSGFALACSATFIFVGVTGRPPRIVQ